MYDFYRSRSTKAGVSAINFDELYQNGEISNHHRTDVRAKKLLRACRSYYEIMLDQQFELKKLKRRMNWNYRNEILYYTTIYAKQAFNEQLLQMFSTTVDNIAKNLSALLCAKKSIKNLFRTRDD